jgi:hypothetical protein
MGIPTNTEANKTVYPKYSISVSPTGITVEAPTKKECLELYRKTQQSAPQVKPSKMLEDAIR